MPGTSVSPVGLQRERLLFLPQPRLGPGLLPFPACLTLACDSSPRRLPGRRDWLQPPYAGPSTQPSEPSVIQVPLLPACPTGRVEGTEDLISPQAPGLDGVRAKRAGALELPRSGWLDGKACLFVNSTLLWLLH